MPRDPQNAVLADIVPVILAGGEGRRLWPLSTKARPKPFLKIAGGLSFLQKTLGRVEGLACAPFVICNERHGMLALQQVKKTGQKNVTLILEPEGRNTAPAIAAAAHYLARQGGDPLLLVMPSDHVIGDVDLFLKVVEKAVPAAREGWLVTFGVKPRSPSSHYGYILAGEVLENGATKVVRFVEKPDKKTAQAYLREDHWLWNSGIFLFSAKTYLAVLAERQGAVFDASLSALSRASRRQNVLCLNGESFSACPSISIDYALMEGNERSAVIPLETSWRDMGTWPSLFGSLFRI